MITPKNVVSFISEDAFQMSIDLIGEQPASYPERTLLSRKQLFVNIVMPVC
jgi:hypothetical protein